MGPKKPGTSELSLELIQTIEKQLKIHILGMVAHADQSWLLSNKTFIVPLVLTNNYFTLEP